MLEAHPLGVHPPLCRGDPPTCPLTHPRDGQAWRWTLKTEDTPRPPKLIRSSLPKKGPWGGRGPQDPQRWLRGCGVSGRQAGGEALASKATWASGLVAETSWDQWPCVPWGHRPASPCSAPHSGGSCLGGWVAVTGGIGVRLGGGWREVTPRASEDQDDISGATWRPVLPQAARGRCRAPHRQGVERGGGEGGGRGAHWEGGGMAGQARGPGLLTTRTHPGFAPAPPPRHRPLPPGTSSSVPLRNQLRGHLLPGGRRGLQGPSRSWLGVDFAVCLPHPPCQLRSAEVSVVSRAGSLAPLRATTSP